jgi:hypothetical protein
MPHFRGRREKTEIYVMNRLLREPDWQPFLREERLAADKFRATKAYKTNRDALNTRMTTTASNSVAKNTIFVCKNGTTPNIDTGNYDHDDSPLHDNGDSLPNDNCDSPPNDKFIAAIPPTQSSAQPPELESRKRIKIDLSQAPSESEKKQMQTTKTEESSRALAYTETLTAAIETSPKARILRDIMDIAMKWYEDSDGTIPLLMLLLRPWAISAGSILEVSTPNTWVSGTTIDFLVQHCGNQSEVCLDCLPLLLLLLRSACAIHTDFTLHAVFP